MMRYYCCAIAAVVLACAALQGAIGIASVVKSADKDLRDNGTYIVYFNNSAKRLQLKRFVAQLIDMSTKTAHFDVEIISELFSFKSLCARLSQQALGWVTQNELVLVVKENEYILLDTQSRGSASLPARPEWHLDRIDQQALPLDHKYTASQYTGKSVDVYVLDTGIHYNHSVFNGRAHYPGCDPIDKLENETHEGEDCIGHGTHIAGLVGGNGTGLATSVTLFSVRVANCEGRASEASLLDGLMCVLEHRKSRNGTRAVVNISLAGIANFSTLSDAVWKILENNIPIIASAGNGRHQTANFDACKLAPAGYRGVITVGATDMDDNAVFGEYDNNAITLNFNLGSCVNVFAPGYNILSSDICTVNIPCYKPNSDSSKTALDDDLGVGCGKTCQKFRSGTSQSTAIVSGAVALLLEKCPTLQHKQIPHIVSTSLSKGRVRFCKAFEFISHFRQLLAVNDVVGSSPNRLLNIGEFPSFNCTIKS